MDIKLLLSTFAAIFIAEIGDKTQLAVFAFAAGGSSRLTVFAGASLALIAATAVAVLAGEGVARAIPSVWLERGAGILFIAIGIFFVLSRADAGGG